MKADAMGLPHTSVLFCASPIPWINMFKETYKLRISINSCYSNKEIVKNTHSENRRINEGKHQGDSFYQKKKKKHSLSEVSHSSVFLPTLNVFQTFGHFLCNDHVAFLLKRSLNVQSNMHLITALTATSWTLELASGRFDYSFNLTHLH